MDSSGDIFIPVNGCIILGKHAIVLLLLRIEIMIVVAIEPHLPH